MQTGRRQEDQDARADRRPDRRAGRRPRSRAGRRTPRVREDPAPARRRKADTRVEEGDPDLEQHVRGHRDRAVDEQRGQQVRHEVMPRDVGGAPAGRDRRLDELARAKREHDRAHEPRRIEPGERRDHQRDGEHALLEDAECDVLEPAPERAGAEQDEEEQDGERHHQLGQARDRGIDDPTGEPGEQAEQRADDDRQHRRREGDLERDLAAVEEAQEEVAAERAVGSQDQQGRRPARLHLADVGDVLGHLDVRGRRHARPEPRRLEPDVDRVRERVVRAVSERAGEERPADEAREHDRDQADPACGGEAVSPEAPPDESPRARRRGWRPFVRPHRAAAL